MCEWCRHRCCAAAVWVDGLYCRCCRCAAGVAGVIASGVTWSTHLNMHIGWRQDDRFEMNGGELSRCRCSCRHNDKVVWCEAGYKTKAAWINTGDSGRQYAIDACFVAFNSPDFLYRITAIRHISICTLHTELPFEKHNFHFGFVGCRVEALVHFSIHTLLIWYYSLSFSAQILISLTYITFACRTEISD